MASFDGLERWLEHFSISSILTVVGMVIGLIAGLGGVALVAAGFGIKGIVGGSIAATIQSGIGNVAAGSLFASLQSAGMTGRIVGIAAVLLVAAGICMFMAELMRS